MCQIRREMQERQAAEVRAALAADRVETHTLLYTNAIYTLRVEV